MQIFFLLILLFLRGGFKPEPQNAKKTKIYLHISKFFCI